MCCVALLVHCNANRNRLLIDTGPAYGDHNANSFFSRFSIHTIPRSKTDDDDEERKLIEKDHKMRRKWKKKVMMENHAALCVP